jgi:hypothetical protein
MTPFIQHLGYKPQLYFKPEPSTLCGSVYAITFLGISVEKQAVFTSLMGESTVRT